MSAERDSMSLEKQSKTILPACRSHGILGWKPVSAILAVKINSVLAKPRTVPEKG